jgi:hypothetical protein
VTVDFLQRTRKEFTLTLTGLHETVLAISERVNRKVQILKLHWQASAIFHQIESIQQEAGAFLAEHVAQGNHQPPNSSETEARLSGTASRIRLLKNDLLQIDALARELEADTLREDLLKIQRDLFIRSAAIERVMVIPGAAACGQTVAQLSLSPVVRVAAVLRGSALLTALETVPLRAGDVVLLVGPREELKQALSCFLARQRARA